MLDLAPPCNSVFCLAEAGGKSILKRPAHLRIGRGQTPTPISEPNASRLTETDSYSKTGRCIESTRRESTNHWDQFEDFPKSKTHRPPSESTASNGPRELAEMPLASMPNRTGPQVRST